jgi:hypothetical protein
MILNDLFARKYKNIKNTEIRPNRPNFGRNRFFSAEFFGHFGQKKKLGTILLFSSELKFDVRSCGHIIYQNDHLALVRFFHI